MSIELGFAPCKIADMQVGIVDVPGHENFIKTMVAGASGMDGVILVVAADDGVMPQTREHLDILTLLGIRHGIVALTKIDRVAPEQRDSVRANVAAFPARDVSGGRARSCPSRTSPARDSIRFWNRFGTWCGRSSPGGSTACSACRWSGHSRCRATAPWWPASPLPARPASATRSCSCRTT